MRIAVCIKHVPDPQAERRIENGLLVRGEEDTLNDLDENAIETALAARDLHGGEVVAITMGAPDAKESLQRALQMGADYAVLLSDPACVGSDVIGTAKVLSAVIAKLEQEEKFDLIITGAASLDGMTSMLPGALGALMERPCIGPAAKCDIGGETASIDTYLPGEELSLEVKYPAIICVTDEVNRPRHPGFKDMLAAKKKTIHQWQLTDLENISPEEIGNKRNGFGNLEVDPYQNQAAKVIVTDSGDGGKQLADFLKSQGFMEQV